MSGFILIKSLLLSSHCVAAVVCSACLSMFSTMQYFNINEM